MPGCLYGAVVRSPHAHALIRGIRLDLEYDWSGIAVVTAADIPHQNSTALEGTDQPVLAAKVVRHVGEAVVLVAAARPELAREAAARIDVDYRPLPALDDASLAEDHPRVSHSTDNVFQRAVLQRGTVSAGIEGHRTHGVYRVDEQDHLALEPLGVLAAPRDDGLEVTGPIGHPSALLDTLTGMFQHDRFVVKQVHSGGSFGRKLESAVLLGAQAALLATKAKRPVKLLLTRPDELRSQGKRHGLIAELSSVVDDEGKLLSLEAILLFDGGAYATLSRAFLERAMVHVPGAYACERLYVQGKVVATHRPPAASFRGSGVSDVHFAVERHLDRIARDLYLDPVAVRLVNLETQGAMVLNGVVAKAADKTPPAPRDRPGRAVANARLMAGRGFAVTRLGGGRPGDDVGERRGHVELALRKNRIQVYAPGAESGQGADTGMVQRVIDALGCDPAQVELRVRASDRVAPDGPFLGSRSVARIGEALAVAAGRLQAELEAEVGRKGTFSELLAARSRDATVRVRVALDELAPLTWDAVHLSGTPYRNHTWQAIAVDLVVDADTGEVVVQRVITATSAGPVVHTGLARLQIEGGVLMGLSGALTERIPRDERGAPQGADLRDTGLWSSLDAPRQKTLLLRPAPKSKPAGLGEVGVIAAAPSVAQAIEAATAAVLDRTPMGAEAILRAIP
ncbi:MAG: xanthine dehydrogenase family protein molybdopterin-binding subunit [Proteobacteria bacterium]|nr:xanthine dehydrogenase family protein molybdopterin-binding subunit [Pseudomonadota bacterium]MCP4917205.1 xanthine dehydrogenase family protein molybdopterin-binding subunit [Pseudomonadota bacterium]